jgi:CRISPR system Cascade subunit CasE
MYLSRLILNPRSRQVQREIADLYQLHRTLMNAFPDGLTEKDERVLFRLETHPRTGVFTLLVQSWKQPDWTYLNDSYLLPPRQLPPGVLANPAVKRFELDVTAGQMLAFRLQANPTVRRKFDDGNHKRVGLYSEEEQAEWLARKAEHGGFRLLSVHTSEQSTVIGWARRNGHRHRLQFLSVRFDGLLQVVEPDRLRETVRQGIGSAKAFGFALLSLAPPRS